MIDCCCCCCGDDDNDIIDDDDDDTMWSIGIVEWNIVTRDDNTDTINTNSTVDVVVDDIVRLPIIVVVVVVVIMFFRGCSSSSCCCCVGCPDPGTDTCDDVDANGNDNDEVNDDDDEDGDLLWHSFIIMHTDTTVLLDLIVLYGLFRQN